MASTCTNPYCGSQFLPVNIPTLYSRFLNNYQPQSIIPQVDFCPARPSKMPASLSEQGNDEFWK